MKKIFFAAIMLVAAYTLYAQEPTVEKVKVKEDKTKVKYSDDTKVKYQATSTNAPMEITTSFEVAHPGVTVISWQPMGDYWYATYKNENNRLIHVYYSTQPWYMYSMQERNSGVIEALPVLNTFVPEAVITSAINTYGNDLYSITALKPTGTPGAEGSYVITVVKNGVSDRVMMNGQGVVMNNRQL